MTEIAFHFNVGERLAYACRLLRKAVSAEAKVWVVSEASTINDLDAGLWSLGTTDFVAHCRADAPPNVLARSPVVLADHARMPAGAGASVLLNLTPAVPDGFGHFVRMIEVVSTDPQDRQQARLRWKHYADRGYPIVRHDVAVGSAT